MVRWINKKKYNTDTSELICKAPLSRMTSALYRKRHSNNYFLVNDILSNYASIQPITWNEASEIVKQYGTREQYLRLFAVNPSKKRTSCDMIQEDYAKLRHLAGRQGIPVTEYLHRTIDRLYKRSQLNK